ncbi:MAG: DUF2207 domain-containing protein [Rhodobacteraceae bacterium]|nr:DUF2207 domain-containing protein [Paracoccaceae bacterium]
MRTPPSNNTSSAGLQLAVAASFLAVAVLAWMALQWWGALSPIAILIVALLIGMAASGIFGRWVAKREYARKLKGEAQIRADREAEKLSKIDTMLGKNSRIPKVRR